MHISPSDPHQLLRELAETTTSAAVTATLDKLDLSQPERISRWLEQNKDLLNKDDVSQLLHIERKLISFSNAKSGDDTICDIERICLALLSPAARTDRMPKKLRMFFKTVPKLRRRIFTRSYFLYLRNLILNYSTHCQQIQHLPRLNMFILFQEYHR